MKNTRMMTPKTVLSMSLVLGLLSCAQPTEDSTVNASSGSKPGDSQGLPADVQIQFNSTAAGTTALAATLDLGHGLILTEARINIAKIKIKPEEDEDESEVEQESEFKAMREERKETIKDQEADLEAQMEAIKKSYEEQIENANSEAAKDSLEAARDNEIKALEKTLAAQHKAIEDEIDAYEEQHDADLKWKGSFVFDLMTNTVSPEIPSVTVLDGTYRRLEFEVKPNRVLEAADPLLNHSVYVAGTVTLNGTAVPFTYALRLSEEFKIRAPQGATVQPEAMNAVVIAFNPSLWFHAADFSSATQDATGTIVIDENNNTGLLDSVKEKIKESAKFGKDEDGDGEVEDEESSDDVQK